MTANVIKLLTLLGALVSYILKSKWASQYTWITQHNDIIEYVYIASVVLLFTLVLFSLILSPIRKHIFKKWDSSLRYNAKTGILYDVKTSNRNVSLRDKTVRRILKRIPEDTARRELGKQIGKEFWCEYVSDYAKFEPILSRFDKFKMWCFRSETNKILVERWSNYDSSVGMGKFETKELSKELTGTLKVINPFTKDEFIQFIEGYVEGVFCQITSQPLTVSKESYSTENGLPTARFTIRRENT